MHYAALPDGYQYVSWELQGEPSETILILSGLLWLLYTYRVHLPHESRSCSPLLWVVPAERRGRPRCCRQDGVRKQGSKAWVPPSRQWARRRTGTRGGDDSARDGPGDERTGHNITKPRRATHHAPGPHRCSSRVGSAQDSSTEQHQRNTTRQVAPQRRPQRNQPSGRRQLLRSHATQVGQRKGRSTVLFVSLCPSLSLRKTRSAPSVPCLPRGHPSG